MLTCWFHLCFRLPSVWHLCWGGYHVSYNGIMCIVPVLKPIYLRFAKRKGNAVAHFIRNKAHKRNEDVCSYKMEISTKFQWLLIFLITSRLYTHSHFSLLKSLLRWGGNIVLIAVVPFQLTMILTQESLTSYLNTPSQRLTELSKYKAGLSEDESQKETVFWLWGWKENKSCITYVVSKEAIIRRYLVFYLDVYMKCLVFWNVCTNKPESIVSFI